jgi:hypothetical protein
MNGISIPCLVTQGASDSYRRVITNVFGGAEGNEGMGLLELSLDWQYISSVILSYPILQQGRIPILDRYSYSHFSLKLIHGWDTRSVMLLFLEFTMAMFGT